MSKPIEVEKPKKHGLGSGSIFWCTECKPDGTMQEMSSFAAARDHYKETGHPFVINTWFNSIYGTDEEVDGFDEHGEYSR